MKTVNDFIRELEALKPSLKKLPIKVIANNGMVFDAEIKLAYKEPIDLNSNPDFISIEHD